MRRGFNFCFVNIYSILKLDINNEYKSTIFLQNYILILGRYYKTRNPTRNIFLMYARYSIQTSLLEIIVSSKMYNKLCTHRQKFVSFAYILISHISFTFIHFAYHSVAFDNGYHRPKQVKFLFRVSIVRTKCLYHWHMILVRE